MNAQFSGQAQHTFDPEDEDQWWSAHGSLYIQQPTYQLNRGELHAFDPVWKDFIFEHPIFYELACTMAFRRHQSIEQLTLPRPYTTIPGTANFVRWEHMWGSAIFVYKMARRHGRSPRSGRQARVGLYADSVHSRLNAIQQSFNAPKGLTPFGASVRQGLNLNVQPPLNPWIEC